MPRSILIGVAIAVAVFLGAAAYALTGFPTSHSTPAGGAATPTPGSDDIKDITPPEASPTGSASALPKGTLAVYARFDRLSDTIVAARADDPENHVTIATVEHALGWGVKGSLSPDGRYVALMVMAGTAANPDVEAQLQVVALDGGEPRVLGEGLALRAAPIWSSDSRSVIVRRNQVTDDPDLGPQVTTIELISVNIADGSTRTIATLTGVRDLYPVGLSPDGRFLYYARYVPGSTILARVPVSGGAAEDLLTVPGIARDWNLSPDGRYVSYLAPRDGGSIWHQTYVSGTQGGKPAAVAVDEEGVDHFNPIWTPDGKAVTFGRAPAAGGQGAIVAPRDEGDTQTLAGPAVGFDVPVAWSPDGTYLLVRSFSGRSADDPGEEEKVIVQGDERRPLSAEGQAEFIGWLVRKS